MVIKGQHKGSLLWVHVMRKCFSILTVSVSISWLQYCTIYRFAKCHHQGEMGKGYSFSLSLSLSVIFLQLYVNLQLSQNKRFNLKKEIPTTKNGDFTHCPNAFFLFEKDDLKAVPFGKGISHHHVHRDQPLLSAKYKNTRISDFHTINT